MSEKANNIYNLTQPCVMAHPNLFVARAFGPKGKESGEPKFSANLVLKADSPDLKGLKELAISVAKMQWPGRNLQELQLPFASGTKLADARAAKRKAENKEPDGEYQRGCAVVAARSKYEPRLAGFENGKLVDYEGDARKAAASKFYFGVEVLAQVNLVPYKGVGRNPDGVCAYLNMVLTTGKGAKIGSTGSSASETFKGYAGHATAEDPTGGEGQGGIPEQW